jgi:two-component system OmpR family sensor kinase
MSLRARLIIGLVALAAAGLVLAAAITYAEQRSLLYEQADRQATAAVRDVRSQIDRPNRPRIPLRGPGEGPIGLPGHDGDDPGGGPGRNLAPAGTYGVDRDAGGNTIGRPVWLGLGDRAAPARPDVPAKLSLGDRRTVGSKPEGEHYRIYAAPRAGGGLTVVAVPFTQAVATLDQLLLVQALVIGGVLLALALAAWWIVRLGLRPLDRIGETAGAIAGGDLSHRVERAEPRTEVGRLGLALNAMLARLEEAFAERRASEERLRRFLADASHELRTPLASIRGYAELFRIGAARDGPDVEKAMTRIEDESARMGVLVEDLLALARLDEVRDIRREPVDMAALAGDAVDDARAVAPDREIDLQTSANGGLVLDGDPSQLRQVLANLMRNALVHTPPGTPIEVTVAGEDGKARVEVRDHGPGLPAGDPAELFERFWRADPARGRGRAGAGLGLSIVAAIVAAHGGRAEAADAPGGGARFTVTLPLREPRSDGDTGSA